MSQPNYFDLINSETPIPLRKRPGLTIEKIYYQSQPRWVIKLPYEQEFQQLNKQEFDIFQMLDGNVSFRELQDEFNLKNSPFRVNYQEIVHVLTEFFKKSLVEPIREGVGPGMHLHSREKRREQLKQKLKSALAIKWRGWDPERFLEVTDPWVGWFFSRPMVCFNMALLALTLVWMGLNYQAFFSRLPELWSFLNPENWLSLGLAVAGSKFCHELGHAYVHKRFDGECHEIGVMIFFFMPTMYCNTSDSWLLKDKWKRMYIGMGGVYAETFMFSIAAICWWFSSPGDFQSFCMNIMFVCSISAVFTNGNPLMKYDGYFVLSDWLEMPNLKQNSSNELQRVFLKYGCGDHRKVNFWDSRYNKLVYLLYGLASFVFRIVLMLTISAVLIGVFQSVGLGFAGLLLAAFSLGSTFVSPVKSLYSHLNEPGNWQQMKRKNLIVTLSVVGVALAAVFAVPYPDWVPTECSVALANERSVYCLESGQIESVHVKPGDRVAEGDLIMVLTNKDFERTALELAIKRKKILAEIQMQLKPSSSAATEKTMAVLKSELATVDQKIATNQQQLDALKITAPTSGIVFGVSVGNRRAETRDDALNEIYGNPLSPRNQNAFLDKGSEVCVIAPAENYEINLAVEQSYASMLKLGQETKFLLDSRSTRIRGEIIGLSINESDIGELPVEIVTQSSSPAVAHAKQLATAEGNKDMSFKDGQTLSSTLFQATSSYQAVAGETPLVYRSAGRGYIHTGYRTLAQRLWHSAAQILQRDL